MNATSLFWPAKAAALQRLVAASVSTVVEWAAALGLADLPAATAARVIRVAVADRIGYRAETGDWFADAGTILDRGYDDCDGHAVVGAALGAASGHRARIVGLSLDGGQPQHVRAEIGDDYGRWFSADSTGPDRRDVVTDAIVAYAPMAVAGLGDAIGDGLGYLAEAIVAPLRPVAAAGRWITDKIQEVYDDPVFWLSLAVIVGCGVGGGPVAAQACVYALPVAKAAMAARAIDVDAWQNAENPAELAREIDRTRRQNPQQFAEAEAEAARVIDMRIAMDQSHEVQMALDPQISTDVVRTLLASGDPDVSEVTYSLSGPFQRADHVWDAVVLQLLRHNWANVRVETEAAYQRALAASVARRRVVVEQAEAECPPINGRTLNYLRTVVGSNWRSAWCLGTEAERKQMSLAATGGNASPITPEVQRYLSQLHGEAWPTVWAAATTKLEQAEIRAFAKMASGRCLGGTPTIRMYLTHVAGEKRWAQTWCNASVAEKSEIKEAAKRRAAALQAIYGGLTIDDGRGLTEAQARSAQVFNRVRSTKTSGGGGGLLALLALLGLAAARK